MGHHFREQEDFVLKRGDDERVPISVIDAVDRARGLLRALSMACEDIDDDRRRGALHYLLDVVDEKLLPFSTEGQEDNFPQRDGS